VRRVEHVDVDGQVDRPVLDALGDLPSWARVWIICGSPKTGPWVPWKAMNSVPNRPFPAAAGGSSGSDPFRPLN
jgi:hypothetical protein